MRKLIIFISFFMFLYNISVFAETIDDESTQCHVRIDKKGVNSNCDGPISVVDSTFEDALVRVDMSEAQCLKMDVRILNPIGWVLNVGNSPSNNGAGGDGADFTNDSELDIRVLEDTPLPGALRAYTNDNAEETRPILTVENFVHRRGYNRINIEIGDQCLRAARTRRGKTNAQLQSDFIYRLDGPDEEASENDSLYWIGLNRVISDGSGRLGGGVRNVNFSLSPNACGTCE